MRNVPFLSLCPSSSSWVGSRQWHSTCSSWTSGCRFPPWGCGVVVKGLLLLYLLLDYYLKKNLDLGFLMMLPHEAALITSGITKILEIYGIRWLCYIKWYMSWGMDCMLVYLFIFTTSLCAWAGSATKASIVACWSSEKSVGTGPAVEAPSYRFAFRSHVCNCTDGRLSLQHFIRV